MEEATRASGKYGMVGRWWAFPHANVRGQNILDSCFLPHSVFSFFVVHTLLWQEMMERMMADAMKAMSVPKTY